MTITNLFYGYKVVLIVRQRPDHIQIHVKRKN